MDVALQALQAAAGGMHTVALADDGTVWSWGVNDEGALGRQTTGEIWEKAPERVRLCASHLREIAVQHAPRHLSATLVSLMAASMDR